jgi:chlorite dismutase
MNYEVLPGKGELFESVFAKVLQVMNEMEGHRETHLYRDVHQPARYLIVSEWHTRGAFDAFTGSARFKSVVDWGKEQVLATRPRHEIYGQDEPAQRTAAAGQCPVHAHG